MRYTHEDIPPHMMESLNAYLTIGRPTGGFLNAVLCNDLVKAFGKADDDNFEIMSAYAEWLYNKCPGNAWGSQEIVDAWLTKKREQRL